MTPSRLTQILIPLVAFALSGLALAETRIDGKIPVYPNAAPQGYKWTDPDVRALLRIGSTIYLTSGDSVETVADWYQQNLPTSCSMKKNASSDRLTCSIGSVIIFKKDGKTTIVLAPDSRGS